MPLSSANLMQRIASMTTPAELGESHTSNFNSHDSGTLPKGRAFHADVAKLAVFEPRHVIAWPDVRVVVRNLVIQLARHRVGFS